MPPEILPEKIPPAIKPNGNCPNGIFLKRNLTCRYISDGKNLNNFCPTGNPPRPNNTLAYAQRLIPLPPFGAYVINEWPRS